MGRRVGGNYFLDEPDLPHGVTRFWLVRHAVVERKMRTALYGDMDVALCPHAMAEQASAYRSLAGMLPDGARWFSSPLSRARKTLEGIAEGKSYQVLDALREQALGELTGIELNDFWKKHAEPDASPFWAMKAEHRPPGGESMEDVRRRVGGLLERKADKYPDCNMVMVSHGGAIRMALAHALNIPSDAALNFSVQNLSVTVLERINGFWRVVWVNRLPEFGGAAQERPQAEKGTPNG